MDRDNMMDYRKIIASIDDTTLERLVNIGFPTFGIDMNVENNNYHFGPFIITENGYYYKNHELSEEEFKNMSATYTWLYPKEFERIYEKLDWSQTRSYNGILFNGDAEIELGYKIPENIPGLRFVDGVFVSDDGYKRFWTYKSKQTFIVIKEKDAVYHYNPAGNTLVVYVDHIPIFKGAIQPIEPENIPDTFPLKHDGKITKVDAPKDMIQGPLQYNFYLYYGPGSIIVMDKNEPVELAEEYAINELWDSGWKKIVFDCIYTYYVKNYDNGIYVQYESGIDNTFNIVFANGKFISGEGKVPVYISDLRDLLKLLLLY